MELREEDSEEQSLWSLLNHFNNEVQDCPLKLDVKTAEPIEEFVLISVNSGSVPSKAARNMDLTKGCPCGTR